jgi:hypothetical protein
MIKRCARIEIDGGEIPALHPRVQDVIVPVPVSLAPEQRKIRPDPEDPKHDFHQAEDYRRGEKNEKGEEPPPGWAERQPL